VKKSIGGFLYICYDCGAIIETKLYKGDNEKLIIDKHMKAISPHLDKECITKEQ